MPQQQVRVLTLEDGDDYRHLLYRVQKGWTIRFSLGTTLWYKNVEFFCNYPSSEEEQFTRNNYNLFDWVNGDNTKGFEESYTELHIQRAGVYQFYIVINNGERQVSCNGSFIVDPSLHLSTAGDELPMDSIVMHTVLCKLLGPFPDWKKQLSIAYETGYNMFHFSPIQVLGESNSCYSIKDHHAMNPKFSAEGVTFDLEMMEHFVVKVHKSWGMFSIVDVVWNHAANDADWIQKHPDAAFNLKNSPHMRPAFLIDRALWYVNKIIMNGPNPSISTESDLQGLKQMIRKSIDQVQLKDFFVVDIKRMMEQFRNMFLASGYPNKKIPVANESVGGIEILQDKEYKRYGCMVDMKYAVKACIKLWNHEMTQDDNMSRCCVEFQNQLHKLNNEKERLVMDIHEKIINNTIGHARYHFVDSNGPKWGKVTELHSISVRYFSYPHADKSYREDCELIETDTCESFMAHNGWVMGYDATKNFAGPGEMIYLNRELIAWGDSIKLNYGSGPEDSPFLWDYMKTYTEQMARIFHGFRIDNCHSTPIHVAEYLLDCARQIRPDLFVMAELFTNDEATDNTFINRLGINSLIRENLGANSSRDLGRHVHRYGGDAVGSFMHPSVRPLRPSMAHAVFMDLTHDNQSLFEARTVFDVLASSALVAATSCGIGSTRGYDELVPHHIHVVNEKRTYQPFSKNGEGNGPLKRSMSTKSDGIICAKEAFNELHTTLSESGYSQIYVDQMTEDVCAVTREKPSTHERVIIVAHNAFTKPDAENYPSMENMENEQRKQKNIPPLKIPGILDEVVIEARLLERDSNYEFQKNDEFINGCDNYMLQMHEHIPVEKANFCKLNRDQNEIEFTDFVPGSVVAFKVSLEPEMKSAVQTLRRVLSKFEGFECEHDSGSEDAHKIAAFSDVLQNISLTDLNRILYRCNEEEKAEGGGGGAYSVPECGEMVYCGLQGLMSFLSAIHTNDDLGHPICDNLRQGNWMLDYTANRLQKSQGTLPMATWMQSVFSHIGKLPRYLVPCYFDAVLTCVYRACLDKVFSLMPSNIESGSSFCKHLVLGSIQTVGWNADCMPPVVSHDNQATQHNTSMAAGLPHFSSGYMRRWGRDTFISLRGSLLLTGRFDLARNIILSFAGVTRHGLIPNLLHDGLRARYNARDATWFWLQAVQDYCSMTKEGEALLSAKVVTMYPKDDEEGLTHNQPWREVQDVIQDILMRHFQGISFRERHAGPDLDHDMASNGFNQSAGVAMETGFVYGGNEDNCGTWMDKMGGSTLSHNAGHPATPRDGSAVEIVGLCKSALRWLIEAYKNGTYRYSALTRKDENGNSITMTYEEWNEKIQSNFEQRFFVSKESTEEMVHKREIYKDTYGSNAGFTDYQLRPNYPIAMCVAPELFVPEHAMAALAKIEEHLLGPLGLKTLDPDDWNYDGFYENSIDSDNFRKAKGFNYHQGPEWVWVLGPFLRAKIYFSQRLQSNDTFRETLKQVKRILLPHYRQLMTSPWRGLAELTNKDGAYCADSCPTQAWSMSCLMEVLQYIEQCESQ